MNKPKWSSQEELYYNQEMQAKIRYKIKVIKLRLSTLYSFLISKSFKNRNHSNKKDRIDEDIYNITTLLKPSLIYLNSEYITIDNLIYLNYSRQQIPPPNLIQREWSIVYDKQLNKAVSYCKKYFIKQPHIFCELNSMHHLSKASESKLSSEECLSETSLGWGNLQILLFWRLVSYVLSQYKRSKNVYFYSYECAHRYHILSQSNYKVNTHQHTLKTYPVLPAHIFPTSRHNSRVYFTDSPLFGLIRNNTWLVNNKDLCLIMLTWISSKSEHTNKSMQISKSSKVTTELDETVALLLTNIHQRCIKLNELCYTLDTIRSITLKWRQYQLLEIMTGNHKTNKLEKPKDWLIDLNPFTYLNSLSYTSLMNYNWCDDLRFTLRHIILTHMSNINNLVLYDSSIIENILNWVDISNKVTYLHHGSNGIVHLKSLDLPMNDNIYITNPSACLYNFYILINLNMFSKTY